MKKYGKTALIILFILSLSAHALGAVPGDLNGDSVVSKEELSTAQDQAKNGKITAGQLDEITHISENYPRTIVDANNRTVTIYKPVMRIIAFGGYDAEIIYLVGDGDKIVAVPDWFKDNDFRRLCLPSVVAKPAAGTPSEPDFEKILKFNPDMIVCWHYYPEKLEEKLPTNITVVALDLFDPRTYLEEAKKLAYLLERDDEINDYITNYYSRYMNLIGDRTKSLSEKERPLVYWERTKPYESFGSKPYITPLIETCGGRNIFAEDNFDIDMTDAESVVKKNPDVIIRYAASKGPETGYSIDDSAAAKELRESVMNRTELASVNAVKNDRVYILNMNLPLGIQGPVGAAYAAKIIQPDLFKDLDPRAINEELLTKYLKVDYDLEHHGVFVYPPLNAA